MCVICLKPAGISITEENLHAMWTKNPHGAGLCFWENAKLKIEKGFMQFESFRDRLFQLDTEDVAFHCRISTSGTICADLTHPFALDQSLRKAKKACIVEAHAAIFHNGVISNFGDKEISDTVDFASSVLAYVPADVRLALLVSLGGNSKFLLAQDGKFYTVGFFQKKDGCEFSNLLWEPQTTKWNGNNSYAVHSWVENGVTHYSSGGQISTKVSKPASSTKKFVGTFHGIHGWWDDDDVFHPFNSTKKKKKKGETLPATQQSYSTPIAAPTQVAIQPIIVNQPAETAALEAADKSYKDFEAAVEQELKELHDDKNSEAKPEKQSRLTPLGRFIGFGH